MCLIISGTASQVRATLLNTKDLLDDILQSNGDGIGYMYANRDGLKVRKFVAKKTMGQVEYEAATRKFVGSMPNDDRNLSIHFRMTTHGDTNLDNCHPYDVVPGSVAMMHNGVLSIGNDANPSRSDTWHFIQEYLADLVPHAPKVVHSKGFVKLMEETIGSNNRFVFMDGSGEMTIVNRDTGIEVNGLWFANTYAWSPELLIPGYRKTYRYTNWREDDHDDLTGYNNWMNKHWPGPTDARPTTTATKTTTGSSPGVMTSGRTSDREDPVLYPVRRWDDKQDVVTLGAALVDANEDQMAGLFAQFPWTSTSVVRQHFDYRILASREYLAEEGNTTLREVVAAVEAIKTGWKAATNDPLYKLVENRPRRVASSLAQAVLFIPKATSREYLNTLCPDLYETLAEAANEQLDRFFAGEVDAETEGDGTEADATTAVSAELQAMLNELDEQPASLDGTVVVQ